MVSKTITVRFKRDVDSKLTSLIDKTVEQHGFTPSRNQILNAAINYGLDELETTYQKTGVINI